MAISSITLPALTNLGTSQSGTFTTDATGDVTTTTTAAVAVNATAINVASSASFSTGAELIDVPGAGISGADTTIQQIGNNLFASNQLSIYNPAILTALSAAGVVITRWNRIGLTGQPKHVRITQQDTGDYYDWVAGMEPKSANFTSGGSTNLIAKAMLVQPGAVHVAPGILVASKTYSILAEY